MNKKVFNLLKHLCEDFKIDEKLRDELPQHQKDIIAKRYGDKFLDMDTPKHTDKIPNIKVEITDETFKSKIGKLIESKFKSSITKNFRLASLFIQNSIFLDTLSKSLNVNLEFIKSDPELMPVIYTKNYKLIDSKSTDVNNPIFLKNMSSLSKFVDSYNRAFPDKSVDYDMQKDRNLVGLQQPLANYQLNLNTLKNDKLYLYISDKAEDKLNMSISKYYDSCQNIYNGSIKSRLLSNVFDKNSKIAYLIFDEPFKDSMGNTVPFTSIARMIIREVKGEIFFDKTYPDKINFDDIVTKYTGLKSTYSGEDYDYEPIDDLMSPYMDNLKIDKEKLLNEKRKLMSKLLNINFNEIEKTDSESIFKYNGNIYYVFNELELDKIKYKSYYDNIYKFIDKLSNDDRNKLYKDTYANYVESNGDKFNKDSFIDLVVNNQSSHFYDKLKQVFRKCDGQIIAFAQTHFLNNDNISQSFKNNISNLIQPQPVNEKFVRLWTKLIFEEIKTKLTLNDDKVNYLLKNYIFTNPSLTYDFFEDYSVSKLLNLLELNNKDVYKEFIKKEYNKIPKNLRTSYIPEDTAVVLARELSDDDTDCTIIGKLLVRDEEYFIFLDTK